MKLEKPFTRSLVAAALPAALLFAACRLQSPDGEDAGGSVLARVGALLPDDGDSPKEHAREAGGRGKEARRSWSSRKQGRGFRVFDVEAPDNGTYYVAAWVDGVAGRELQVYVDGELLPGAGATCRKEGWQGVFLSQPATGLPFALTLSKGSHTLAFAGAGSGAEVPAVGRVRIGKTALDAGFPEAEFDAFLDSLRRDSKSIPKVPASLAKTADGSDPMITYDYAEQVHYTYTWNTTQYLTQGTSYTFQTSNPSPSNCDPILYVFHKLNPGQYTWMNDDFTGGGNMSKITFTPQVSGDYIVLLRSYAKATGTVTVKRNGTTIGSSSPVAGTWIGTYAPQSGTMNYFTANSASDTRIWLMDNTGKVRAYNDDYAGTGTYSWGALSRVRKSISQPISNVLVSEYSSPQGYADVYMKLGEIAPSTRALHENLTADDAIRSGPSQQDLTQEDSYNCYGFSGGLTEWIEPHHSSPWTIGDMYGPWDYYYSNTCSPDYTGDPGACRRYAGAWNYAPAEGDGDPLHIDLYQGTGVMHASIRNPANGHPHGYDWEGKLGPLERVMHPRKALQGERYGLIVRRYYWDGTYAPAFKTAAGTGARVGGISFQESERQGLSVKQRALAFTPGEKGRIVALTARAEPGALGVFEKKYQAWKETWSDPALQSQSNSEAYARSAQYLELRDHCRAMGKSSWPMLIARFEAGDRWVMNLLRELVLPGREGRMKATIQDWVSNHQTPDGKYITYSQRNTWIRFLQDVLASDL